MTTPVAFRPRPQIEPITPSFVPGTGLRDRAEALASELVMARRDIEAHVARAQRDLETQVATSSKRGEEAVQVKEAAESATAELRQSLLNEQDRAEALARELARAQQDLKTQVEQAAESATAELRQSLEKEHDRTEALAGELARAQRDIERQAAQSRSDRSRFVGKRPRPRTLQIAGLPRSSLHQLRSARSSSMTFQLRERTRISAPASLISRFQKQNQVRRTDRPT